MNVLDDSVTKLTLASLLTSDILKDKLAESLDPEVLLTLREHFQVEQQYYEFLDSDLWKLQFMESKNQELFHELDLCLADSTRTVTRVLKRQPVLVRRLRELIGKRPLATLHFITTFNDLRQLIMIKLRMTAEEERHMHEQLTELQRLQEEDTLKFVELTERLAVERNEHEQVLSAKDAKIQRLQNQIEQLTNRTASERALFEEKMRDDAEQAEKAFKIAEKELQKQLDQLQHQLEVDGNENYRAELLYHRKKNLRAMDVTHLIDKYDQDMQLKHESVVDMRAVHKKERTELEALAGYFENIDEEARKLKAEHEAIHDSRNAELAVERRNQQAALLVQGLFSTFYKKNGPKEPKKKKAKKKKDPYAGLRGRPKSGKNAAAAAAAGGPPPASASAIAASSDDESVSGLGPGSAVAAAAMGATGEITSPVTSGPDESDEVKSD